MTEQLSEVIFSWSCPETLKYKKTLWWYLISLILLVLLIWWSIADSNYLFIIFLLLFYFVILVYERRAVETIRFAVTQDGVALGERFYAYGEFAHFFIIYQEQGMKNLYLDFKNPFRGRLVVPLINEDPVPVREFLLKFLAEDLEREDEPFAEVMRRWLRL